MHSRILRLLPAKLQILGLNFRKFSKYNFNTIVLPFDLQEKSDINDAI